MRIDRRTMLAGGVALAAAPALAKPREARADWYDQGDHHRRAGRRRRPLRPRGAAAPERPGLGGDGVDRRDAAARHGDAGRQPGSTTWATYKEDVAVKRNVLNANPDRLVLVRSAADILKAKREKKFALGLPGVGGAPPMAFLLDPCDIFLVDDPMGRPVDRHPCMSLLGRCPGARRL